MKLNRLLVCLILLPGFLRLANGQDEKLVLNPPLSSAFPLDLKPDGMHLKFPVLVNAHTILGSSAVLRFIYMDPNAGIHPRGGGSGGSPGAGGAGAGGGHGRHQGSASQAGGDAGSAYARDPAGDETAAPKDSPPWAAKDATSEIRTEVWTQADLFRDALDEAAGLGTTVVYSVPGRDKPLSTTIDLPDGVLLAEIGNHVKVLGLTAESRMSQGGMQPGDEIRSFGATRPVSSLKDFQQIYFPLKEDARKSGQPYSIDVWRPSESKVVTIQVTPPPSLQSLF